jgi:hypothetical protein
MFGDHLLQLGQKHNEQVDELEKLCSKTHPYGCSDLIVSALRQLKIPAGGAACSSNHYFLNSRVHVLGARTLGHRTHFRKHFQDSASVIPSYDGLACEHDDMRPIDLDHGFEQVSVRFHAGNETPSLSSSLPESGASV